MESCSEKRYMSENPEVAAYFETLPTSLQEMIMQDNKQFETKEEIEAFARHILEC